MKQGAIVHEVPAEMVMQWMDGEFAREQSARLVSHLDGCAECRAVLAELEQGSEKLAAWQVRDSGRARPALARLRSLTGQPRGRQLRSMAPRYAAAGGALLLALTFWAQLSPSRIQVDEQTVRAKLIKTSSVAPNYPEEARKNHIEGGVVLHIVVGRTGSVKRLDVVKGDPALAQAAAEAVRKWKFEPTFRGGRSVEVESEIRVDFTLLP